MFHVFPASKKTIIRDVKELFQFFEEHLVVRDAFGSNTPMLNRLFHYISPDDIEDYRSSFPEDSYKYIDGTLKIHQVINTPGDNSHILFRNTSFACNNCFEWKLWVLWKESRSVQTGTSNNNIENHVFRKTKKSYGDLSDDEYRDLNKDEINELESAEFMETEASKLIQGDIAVIVTGDDHPYYLLKLLKDPYETEGTLSDDYNHEFPPLHRVIEDNYFEFHKTNNEVDIYYTVQIQIQIQIQIQFILFSWLYKWIIICKIKNNTIDTIWVGDFPKPTNVGLTKREDPM